MTYVPCGTELIELLEQVLQSPKKRREMVMNREQLREILTCIPVRRWLHEQACQTLDKKRATKARLLIVEIMQYSGNLWKGGTPSPDPEDYDEALSRTWEWFGTKLCPCESETVYDAEMGSFTTWFNQKLKWHLLDVIRERQKDEQYRISLSSDDGTNLLENISDSKVNAPNLIDELLVLIQQDQGGRLSRSRMRCHPHVTCQRLMILILEYLHSVPQLPWEQLAQNLDVNKDTLSQFYRGTCRPRFRQFLKDVHWL